MYHYNVKRIPKLVPDIKGKEKIRQVPKFTENLYK